MYPNHQMSACGRKPAKTETENFALRNGRGERGGHGLSERFFNKLGGSLLSVLVLLSIPKAKAESRNVFEHYGTKYYRKTNGHFRRKAHMQCLKS